MKTNIYLVKFWHRCNYRTSKPNGISLYRMGDNVNFNGLRLEEKVGKMVISFQIGTILL